MTLRIINPMPVALLHYEQALCHTLQQGGIEDWTVVSASIEAGKHGHLGRALQHLKSLAASRADTTTLLLWPSFGYCELLLDAVLNPRLTVVFHDAQPLRPQFAMKPWQGRLVGRIPRVASSGRVIVHTELAQQVLGGFGWDSPRILPHPLLPRGSDGAARSVTKKSKTCLVLGQYKPTRDIELLEKLPWILPDWTFKAVGRGWPRLDGWHVEPTFVSEERVTQELLSADVVLVPYPHFFQSGVLAQAFEVERPAVTAHHEQTISLYGSDWAGLVTEWTPEAVAAALVRAGDVTSSTLANHVTAAQKKSVAAWRTWAGSF